ncbi:hypothetical protein D3C85_1423940 [compost metagenome]
MFSKIGLWGSVASIVALVYSLSSTADQTTQNVNGSHNTVVGENHGGININYGSSVNGNNPNQLILKNSAAGSVLIRSETDMSTLTDKTTHICLAISGTPIQLTGREKTQGVMEYKEVKVLAGQCEGKIGWAAHEVIAYK